MQTNELGHVVSLWRYPVKSMAGTGEESLPITANGILGDRAYALVDVLEGSIVTAKEVRTWPNLMSCRAEYVHEPQIGEPLPPVRITLTNGTTVLSDQADRDAFLSEEWGHDTSMIHTRGQQQNGGYFFDDAPIHIVTTATLDHLRQLRADSDFDVRRFRPNLIIETSGETGFLENGWIGKTLAVGDEIRLQIVGPCPRCVMTTLPQTDLPSDPHVLKTAAQHNQSNVGVYAKVIQTGLVQSRAVVREVNVAQ